MDNRPMYRGKWHQHGRGGPYGKRFQWSGGKSRGLHHSSVHDNGPSRGGVPSSSTAPPIEHDYLQKTLESFEVVPVPYDGWKLYFQQEGYQNGSATVAKLKAMEGFIRKNIKMYSATDIMERRAFSVDIKILFNDEDFSTSWSSFQADLLENAEHSLNCLGLAMHQVVVSEIKSKLKARVVEENSNELPSVTIPVIRARITNYDPIIQLKNIKTNYYGKLVSVRGTIMRVGNIKLLCTWMAFECNSCHGMQCVKQPEGVFTEPTKCTTSGCKAKSFCPLLSSPYTQTINWRSVRLQELVADDQREGGRVPRTVECEITEDLLDSCVPGDVVTLIGIVKVRNNEETMKRKAPSMFLLYIDTVSVVNNKSQSSLGGRNSAMGVKLEVKDLCAIKDISAQNCLFKLLVNSLCPTIYGHELVKSGLLLALFGGSQHHVDGRGDPHVLIVGDPGLGKSQMLQACTSVAPRGMYVCGNTSTSSGLTVTLSRESGGDYALEAGALVLSDQGVCCIDEFDKMSNQHQALLEAMEQQSISIAKAGVVCSLPARTSILAAANPSGGHYNRAKTVSENLRIGSALLSRFDLVFILLDQPDEQLDNLLSEHIMGIHSGLNPKLVSQPSTSLEDQSPGNGSGIRSLRHRLKVGLDETMEPIPHLLLRKYIAYARKYIHPKLSSTAAKILQTFYLELRRQHQSMDSTPITTRQLESMIRLTEARAKLELRDEILETDALDVVELMKYSLVDTLSDGCGGLDFQRSQHGSGMSSKNQVKKFINALQRQAEIRSNSKFSTQELKEVGNMAGLQIGDFGNFLSTLNIQGFLLKKGPHLYQLLTVDY